MKHAIIWQREIDFFFLIIKARERSLYRYIDNEIQNLKMRNSFWFAYQMNQFLILFKLISIEIWIRNQNLRIFLEFDSQQLICRWTWKYQKKKQKKSWTWFGLIKLIDLEGNVFNKLKKKVLISLRKDSLTIFSYN